MSQMQTKIAINGQDNASPVMRQVGDNAQKLAQRITSLGRTTAAFFGAGAAMASFGVMGKEALDATKAVDTLDKAFASITGSAAGAEEKLGEIREMSERLGLNFLSTAQAAKGFFAAGQGTELAGDMNRIFESVMTASTALGLSADESGRTLLALQQMISKGKVSAEELRQQLGEALPGAFKLFADAAGVSTAELDKMLERGEVGIDLLPKFADLLREKYLGGVEGASRGVTAELNRLSNAWFDFKASLMDADQAASAVRGLAGILKNVTDNGDDYFTLLKVGATAVLAYTAAQKAANLEIVNGAHGIRALLASASESRTAILDETRLTLENAAASDRAAQARLRQAQAVVSGLKLQKQYIASTEAAIQVEKRLELSYLELSAAQKAAAASSATLATAQGRMRSVTSGMSKAMGVVGTSVALVKKGASGLVGFLGGPWGAAFTVGAAAVAYLSSQQSLAEQATKLQTEAMKQLNAVTREGTDGMRRFAEVNQAVAKAELGKALDKLTEAQAKLRSGMFQSSLLLQMGSLSDAGYDAPAGLVAEAEALQKLGRQATEGKASFAEFRDALASTMTHLRDAGQDSSKLSRELARLYEMAKKGATGETGIKTIESDLERVNSAAFIVNQALERTIDILHRLGSAAASSGLKLDEALNKSEFARYLASLTDKQRAAANALKGAGLDQEKISRALSGDLAEFGDDADKIRRIIENTYASTLSKTASSADSARSRIEQLRREIDELNGRSTRFDTSLAKKLEDIARAGKDAGMSARDIRALKDAYADAFQADRARDFAEALDKVRQQTAALGRDSQARRAAENLRALTEAAAELAASASTPGQMVQGSAALAGLWGGLQRQNAIEDLQAFSDFYRQYGELTGKFTPSQELQTRIIHNQVRAWQDAGVAMEDTLEMEKLLLQQASRNPFDGMTRGLRAFGAQATDLAAGLESSFSSAFQNAGDALGDFVTTGKLDFNSLVNSMISDLARLAGRAAMGGIATGLGNWLGSLIGSGGSGYFSGGYGGTALGGLDSIIASIFHEGGIVGRDSSFARALPAVALDGAPRLHSGGLLRADERAAILQTGERVLSRRETSDLDQLLRIMDNQRRMFAAYEQAPAAGAQREPTVTVNIVTPPGQTATQRTRTDQFGNKTIDVFIGDAAAKQALQPGSNLSRAVSASTGATRPVTKR